MKIFTKNGNYVQGTKLSIKSYYLEDLKISLMRAIANLKSLSYGKFL